MVLSRYALQNWSTLGKSFLIKKAQEHSIKLSSDKHGNLYVSVVNKNPCVQVLSNRGEVLHSFGRKELSDPHGVCVTEVMNMFMWPISTNTIYKYTPPRGSMWPHLDSVVVMKVTLIIHVE